MSRIIFTLAPTFALGLSLGAAGTADARPLSIASADRSNPVCVGDDCPNPCVDDGGCPDPEPECVADGCEPECVDDGCDPDPIPKLDLDLCIELDIKLDGPCLIKVADDCEDSCDGDAVMPACVQKLGMRASSRSLAQCQAEYQALCVSQCEEGGGGFCQDVWVGSDVCIELTPG